MTSSGEEEPSSREPGRRSDFQGSKLFLGGLSWDTSEEKLRDHFHEYGQILEVVVMRDKLTGRPRGFGFVTFNDPEPAERAVKETHVIDGRQIDVKMSVPQEGKPKACKVFVGGLSPETSEDDFKAYFSQFGAIAEVQIMQDHMSGRSRGFGFVTFEEDASAQAVFDAGSMHDLGGKRVEVKPATPKGSGSQAARQAGPRGRLSGEYDPSMMRAYTGGMAGPPPPYSPYPLYGYAAPGRPGGMIYPPMAPQYMMMPAPGGMPSYPPSGAAGYGPPPYQSGGGVGPSGVMPFTPPSPQGMLHHPFSGTSLYGSSSPSPSPPYRSTGEGSVGGGPPVRVKTGAGRGKVDSASSLDAHVERHMKNLSLE